MNLEESKKKETIRISKKDLLKLLSENEHMTKQITELQTRMNELVEENRRLKLPAKVASGQPAVNEDEAKEHPFPTFEPQELDKEDIEEILKPNHRPSYPSFRRDVYFDGSNNR
jgi:regulator of replication initiation timing